MEVLLVSFEPVLNRPVFQFALDKDLSSRRSRRHSIKNIRRSISEHRLGLSMPFATSARGQALWRKRSHVTLNPHPTRSPVQTQNVAATFFLPLPHFHNYHYRPPTPVPRAAAGYAHSLENA